MTTVILAGSEQPTDRALRAVLGRDDVTIVSRRPVAGGWEVTCDVVVQLNDRVPAGLKDAATERARAEGTTRAAVTAAALSAYLGAEEVAA
jgi:hypothetical protein